MNNQQHKQSVRFADILEMENIQLSKQSSQSKQNQYQQKQQKQKMKIMNDYLFSYNDEDNQSIQDDNLNESPQLYNQFTFKQQISQTATKKYSKKPNSNIIRSADASPKENIEEKNQRKRRGSQQISLSSYPKIYFDKNFELEVKNDGDSIPYSETNTSQSDQTSSLNSSKKSQKSSSSKTSSHSSEKKRNNNNQNDDDVDVEEEDLENSQIQKLKRKQSKRIFNSSDSSSSNSSDSDSNNDKNSHSNHKNNHKKKVYQIIKKNINDGIQFFLTKARGIQLTPNRIMAQNQQLLHNNVQQKIREKEIKILSHWKLCEGATDINDNVWEDIKQLMQLQITQIIPIQSIVNQLFINNIQQIFESSIVYLYLPEFREICEYYERKEQKQYNLVLKKEIIERLLNYENEEYVRIIYDGHYILETELSDDFIQIFQSSFSSSTNNKRHLILQIMVFYYSVEYLAPKMLRYIIGLVDDIVILRQILRYFILYHLNLNAKEVFQKLMTKRIESEKDIIQLCSQSQNYDFLFSYYEITRIKIGGWLEDGEYQKLLVKSLGRSTGMNFQAVLFFIKNVKLWTQKNLIHLIAETLAERLDASNNDTHFLFTFSNPFKIIVLIIELLQILISNEIFHKNICTTTLQKYSNFAKTLIRTAIDEEQMYALLIDWDLEGRKLLYIIYENSMKELISESRVQDVIEILWNGNSNSTINIQNFFSISQNLLVQHGTKFSRDSDNLHFVLQKQYYKKEDFLGRMSVWIKQIKLRYFIDQVQIFAFLIAFLAYFLYSFSIFTGGFYPIRENRQEVLKCITNLQDHLSIWIIVPLFIAVNLPINAISNLIYVKEFEKNASLTLGQWYDLLFGLITILYIAFIYSMQHLEFNDAQNIMTIFLNVLTAFIFLRFVLCVTVTRVFGPVFQALNVIVFEVAKFMNAFLALLILFSFIGFIVFNQMEAGKFKSFVTSLLFLVESMFGQFSFSDFSNLYPGVGYIFMILYLYMFAIVLLNMLVAILTFNFELTNRQAIMLHYQHTIFHVRQGNYMHNHGCLIVIPITLEFLIIPYLILKQLFNTSSAFFRGLQETYIYISYTPILILSILFAFTFNLILLPFAFIHHAFLLSLEVYHRTIHPYILIKWIFFGIFLMLKQLLYEDMKQFSRYLLSKESYQEREKSKQKKIIFDETMEKILQTVSRMYTQGITYCTISELFTQIKEDNLHPYKIEQKETCVGYKSIVGVHLLKRRNIQNNNNNNSVSPHQQEIQQQQLRKQSSSTPLQLHLLIRQNSKSNLLRIDKINVKHTFQGIKDLEDQSEYIYEYFFRFCFKDIARNDEQRDAVINLHNLLKLHEHFTPSQLRVIIHPQLYKTIKNT